MEILTHYIEATNTHDFNLVEELIHPEAVYVFGGKRYQGHEEIRGYFENSWGSLQDEIYGAEGITWLNVTETSAVCLYTYTFEGYANGTFINGTGNATNVFAKDNNQWKLIHEHLSRIEVTK